MSRGRKDEGNETSKGGMGGAEDDVQASNKSFVAELVAATLRRRLRAALIPHNAGEDADADVAAAVKELQGLHRPFRPEQMPGNFLALSPPDFPDCQGQTEDGRRIFSLGRMSFEMFAPPATRCAIDAITNPVYGDGPEYAYDFVVSFEVLDGPMEGKKGVMRTFGFCGPMSTDSRRVPVRFVGVGLRSFASEDSAAWTQVFMLSNKAAEATSGDDDDDELVGAGAFPLVKRFETAAKGHFDVLYLDSEIRVTRGNRGTLVVAARE